MPATSWCTDPMTDLTAYLAPTRFVDSDSPSVRGFAAEVVAGERDPAARAVQLYEVVRDRFRYDPYHFSENPAHYTASAVLAAGQGWCVPKAVLLCAAARAVGIPARLGFADVRNHLLTPRLKSIMNGVEMFAYHGYTELHLDGRWVKVAPTFNAELCARFGVAPMEFDGHSDALLHQFTPDGSRYMEYVRDRGTADDLPLELILRTLREIYGPNLFEQLASPGAPDKFTPEPSSAP